MLKYFGWILSIVLLAVTVLVYTQVNAAASQNKKVADNLTVSYQAVVAQNNRLEADWKAQFNTLNTTWATQYAQVQAKVNTDVKTEVDKAVAARDAFWQSQLKIAADNASAVANAQIQATFNSTISKVLADRDAAWNVTLKNAITSRDAQWRAALAGVNVSINLQ